jgi:hypothetical protein
VKRGYHKFVQIREDTRSLYNKERIPEVCTAKRGYQKFVRLKMDGMPEPWQSLKYEVCFDYCV